MTETLLGRRMSTPREDGMQTVVGTKMAMPMLSVYSSEKENTSSLVPSPILPRSLIILVFCWSHKAVHCRGKGLAFSRMPTFSL